MTNDNELKDLYNLNLERSRYSLMLHITNDLFFEYNCADDVLFLFNSQKGEGATSSFVNFREELLKGLSGFCKDSETLVRVLDNRSAEVMGAEVRLTVSGDENYRWYKLTAKYSTTTDSIIGNLHDINATKEEVDKLKEQALIDPLSKVYNKAAGIDLTRDKLATLPEDHACALAVLDIDNFKTVNDTYGHLYGDAVISMVAGSIKNVIGDRDLIGRFGGDEFFVFIEDGTQENLDKILELIRSTVNTMSTESSISCSIGCTRGHGGSTWEDMFKQADSALYKAKQNGKNRYEYFTGEYYEESISYGDNGLDPDHSTKEHSITEVALEIASKAQNSESAIINMMRHVAIQMHLDEITIFYYDVPDSRADVLFRYYKEFEGQFNVINCEKRKGHYAPEDMVLFRDRMAKLHVLEYTPAFKEGFQTKFHKVLSYSDGSSMLFVSNVTPKDKGFCLIGFKNLLPGREWTAREKKDLLDVEKIIAMYLKSAYTTTTREKAMEERLTFMPSGAFTLQYFYQEAGKVTCSLPEGTDNIALVHYQIRGLYEYELKYGRAKGEEFVTGFVRLLTANAGKIRITAQYEDLVNLAVLTSFDKLEFIIEDIQKEIDDYISSGEDYAESFTIRAAICPFKAGQNIGDALDAARNANLHVPVTEKSVRVAEYVEIEQ